MGNTIGKNNLSPRNYGIDLLRMVAMAMVLMLHTLLYSNLLKETEPLTLKYEIVWFIEIICYCCVNCFVIISGYVGLNAKFRLSRIVMLWSQVAFYCLLFEAIHQMIKGEFNILWLIRSAMPVMTERYWFFSSYFVLSLIMPFLNKAVKCVTLRQSVCFSGVLLLFLSVVETLTESPIALLNFKSSMLFSTSYGYSLVWLIVLYVAGAVLKRLDEEGRLDKIKTAYMIVAFAASAAVEWTVKYWCDSQEEPLNTKFIINYTSPFVVIMAMSLLVIFSKISLKGGLKKAVAFLSPAAFACYLIQENTNVCILFKRLVAPLFDMRLLELLPCLLATVLIVYTICSLADILRAKLFKAVGIDKLCKKLDTSAFMKKIMSNDE